METKMVKQSDLTGECWSVQIWGLDCCKKCEYRGTKDCGGKKIRKSKKNEKGIQVPIG